MDTTETHPYVIPEAEKPPKIDIRVERTGTHKYKTRPSTNIVNHVTTFKNSPSMFKMVTAEKIKRHMGTYYFARIFHGIGNI